MKHLKRFETVSKPGIGDYVQMKFDRPVHLSREHDFKKFIEDNIGIITYFTKDYFGNSLVDVEYGFIPKDLTGYVYYGDEIRFNTSEIFEFADTKEELELKLQARKYNL